MLYWLSGFRPHSSSDPFGATFPPGEGIFPVLSHRDIYFNSSAGTSMAILS